MSTQQNGEQGSQMASIPQVTTFQFDKESIGKIKDSVNLFRGTVSLPLNLVTLPGLKDLDVNFMLLYGSNIKAQLENWNLTHPTGPTGLGWDMMVDKIILNKQDSGTSSNDIYYLIAGGTGNQLIQTGTQLDGALIFQTRNYEFWKILYYPNQEIWKITHENGICYTYGDKNSGRNTVEQGVKWGNWMGDSALTTGQEQYATAWNLAEKENIWGNKIIYTYDQEIQYVGNTTTGKQYTQASYLKQITDSLGRTLILNYGDKYGANNPSSKGIIEYQAANTKQSAPNAYQDQYETKYLESLEVKSESGSSLFTIHFGYDFINTSNATDEAHGLLYKRVLTDIWQVSAEDATLPGYEFTYFKQSTDSSPGSLKSITFPFGGSANYDYKKQDIQASRNLKINNPITGSIPRVWFGPEYSVVTWYNQSTKTMKAQVYSWSGEWISTELSGTTSTVGPFYNVDFDMESLGVISLENQIIIYFTNKQTNSLELYFYQKSNSYFGTFNLVKGPERIMLKAGATQASTVISGDNFIVIYNKEFASQPFYGYQWIWKERLWKQNVILPSFGDTASADYVAINARGNYYLVSFYTEATKNAKFQLFYHNNLNIWKNSSTWFENITVFKDPDNPELFPLGFAMAGSSTACSYITDITENEVKYDVRIFQWDINFNILNPSSTVVNSYTSPIVDEKSQFNALSTFNNGALVANNPNLNRYVGGPGNANNPLNWIARSFMTITSGKYDFIFGEDMALMSEDNTGSASNSYYIFNPNSPNSGGWGTSQNLPSTGTNPTLLDKYLTAGQDVFYRQTDGTWKKLSQSLSNLTAPETVKNTGVEFLIYQDNTGTNASTYIAFKKNGQLSAPKIVTFPGQSDGQKVFIEQTAPVAGTQLSGYQSFFTYPANQEFEKATSLNLYRVAEGSIENILNVSVVANVNIENLMESSASFWQSYEYKGYSFSKITYDAQNSLPQFPQVQAIPQTKSPEDPVRPSGSVISYYSNGISEQSLNYPLGWIYNYNLLLNGTLLGKKTYDTNGNEVASELNYYSIYERSPDSTEFLYAAYYRNTQQTIVNDGVTKTVFNDYYNVNGELQTSYFDYSDSEGKLKRLIVAKTYALQVQEYANAMQRLNLLNNVVQEITTVRDMKADTEVIIASGTTTWKDWSDDTSGKWAAFQKFQWEGPSGGSETPDFDFSDNKPQDGWLLLSEVNDRAEQTGNITEQTNVDQMITSYLYDKNGQHQIAEFPEASTSLQETTYYSFEEMESPQNWTTGSKAVIIPNDNTTTIDANTGVQSLQLPASTSPGEGISAEFSPSNLAQDLYIFSCFFKKPKDFSDANGKAQWSIKLTQQGTGQSEDLSLELPDINEEWSYIFIPISLEAFTRTESELVTISIEATNANSQKYILLDNLRFSPLQSTMGAINLDAKTALVDATVGANGELSKIIYDSFQQLVSSTNSSDELSSIYTFYYSRSGNEGVFNPQDPNTNLTLNAADGGKMYNFKNGDECWQTWTPGSVGWEINKGELEWAGTGEGTLTLKDVNCTNQYSVLANVLTHAAPTGTLGIRIGAPYTIEYDVSRQEWLLLQDGDVIQNKSHKRFKLSDSTDNNPYGTQWLLIVNQKSIVFIVDGKQIFGFVNEIEIDGVPQIFISDPATITYLGNGRKNRVNQTYINSNGSDQQSQVLFDTEVIAIQNVYDSMGRAAIHTKAAFIEPDSTHDLFAYRNDLASYDWTTDTMTGLIQQIYPDDEGYPYFRETYEPSALGRVIEEGMPGKNFSIGSNNTLKLAYGANDGSFGLPKAEYFQNTQTDQNGNLTSSIADQRGGEVIKISQKGSAAIDVITSFNLIDDFGNPVEQRSPNYYTPPAGSSASDWAIINEFDYLGRNIKITSSDSGIQNMIYDIGGRIRFRQDAQGAANGNYQYFKYDAAGRLIEMGYLQEEWNESDLQNYAQNTPSWPATPDTWRKKLIYNGDGTKDNQIGRLIQVEVNSSDQNTASSTEEYTYNLNSNILQKTWQDLSQQQEAYTMNYGYNSMGDVILIEYPTTDDLHPMQVSYGYNEVGQVIGVGSAPEITDDLAAYAYNASGKPVSEKLNAKGNSPVERTFTYNSPVWLENIKAKTEAGNRLIFEEQINYEAQNANETTYFNGQPSSLSFNYEKDGTTTYQDQQVCHYNALGALSSHSSNSSSKTYNYDDNSNFEEVEEDGDTYTYAYNENNTVKTLTNASGQNLGNYQYDLNGNIKQAISEQPGGAVSRKLQFNYDPGIVLTRSIDDELNSGTSYQFEYDGMNQRTLKQTVVNSEVTASKSYIRGLNTGSLLTLSHSSTGETSEYIIYGPLGTLALTDLTNRKWLIRDHLNSTRVVLDDEANLKASYSYGVFGKLDILFETDPNFCDLLYTGQEWDYEFALYNFKSRFYFSEIGRFGAIDPSMQFFSPYVYAGNNPILFIDPSGNFSIGNFFSAIAGAIIGAVEILIGVAIDVVAGVLEVVTGGLSTPASIGLAALSGFFYGAGASSLAYSTVALITNDFSWKDYGISMGIGAVTGAIASGIGAAGTAVQASAKASITAATEAGKSASTLAKVANVAAKPVFTAAGSAVGGTTGAFLNNVAYGRSLDTGLGEAFVKGIITGSLGWAIPTPAYKAGWGQFAKRAAANIAKSESIGIGTQVTSNAIHGKSLETGLLNTVVSGAISGTKSAIGAKDYGKAWAKDFEDSFTITDLDLS